MAGRRRHKYMRANRGRQQRRTNYCWICNRDLISQIPMYSHNLSVHKKLKKLNIQCGFCGTLFATQAYLEDHITLCHSNTDSASDHSNSSDSDTDATHCVEV